MNILNLVFKNLFRRKGRFIFTLLGITIGMASFVALLSLGGNMRSEVKKQAEAMGANLMIMPENICVFNQIAIVTGESISELLQYDEYEKIAEIEGITVIPHLTQKAAIKDDSGVVMGILPEETKNFRKWKLEKGEYFTSESANEVVIGSIFAETHNLSIGNYITIRGEEFTVKGILGLSQSNDDDTMFMPLTVAQRVFEKEGLISYMSAKVDNLQKMDKYIASILDVSRVQVTTDEQLLGSVLTILGSVNITLQLIAAISLISAAFGIINTMMTAVYERKREIGIMRAIGSKSSTIFKIFLIESGLYGLLGGVTGVILGLIASVFAGDFISKIGSNEMLKGVSASANFDIKLILSSIAFSLVISMIAGFYPAWKASKLTPVEAINQ